MKQESNLHWDYILNTMNKKLHLSSGIIRNKTEILHLTKESKKKKLSRYFLLHSDSPSKALWDKNNCLTNCHWRLLQESHWLLSIWRSQMIPAERWLHCRPSGLIRMRIVALYWKRLMSSVLILIYCQGKEMMTYQSKRFTVVKES